MWLNGFPGLFLPGTVLKRGFWPPKTGMGEAPRPQKLSLLRRARPLIARRRTPQPCLEVPPRPRRQRPLARNAALRPAQPLAARIDARLRDRRKQPEIHVHWLKRGRPGGDR